MRSIVTFLLLAMLAAAANAADTLRVEVTQLGEGHYQVTVTFPDAVGVDDAQNSLMPVAAELCGIRPARLGHYRFASTAPLDGAETPSSTPASMRLEQQLHCDDRPAATMVQDDRLPAPRTAPTADEEAMIHRRTLDYLAAKDAGQFDTAHAMFSADAGELFTATSWRLPRASFNAVAGSAAQPMVNRVTWYDDPANAPGPGRYAAADYSASYADAAFYCGYLMWLLQPDGSYRIVREEEGHMTHEVAAKVAPSQMTATRRHLGCRD